jgi:hypothetical protein
MISCNWIDPPPELKKRGTVENMANVGLKLDSFESLSIVKLVIVPRQFRKILSKQYMRKNVHVGSSKAYRDYRFVARKHILKASDVLAT